MKKFYKWLKGKGEEYPEEVKWIKTGKKMNNNKLPEELITPEEGLVGFLNLISFFLFHLF